MRKDRGDRKVNPGVESAKSLFFGVEVGEGWHRRNRRDRASSPESERKDLPRMNADFRGSGKDLPLINTDNTDLKNRDLHQFGPNSGAFGDGFESGQEAGFT